LLDAVSSIPVEFARIHKTEQRSLSEIFAYFVIRSPAMRLLVEVLVDHDNDFIRLNNIRASNVDDIVEKVSRAIVGRSIDDRLPLLHEIICGPFDADKLDYFIRDARNAGTPSLLDISRLVQKIALQEMDAKVLPGTTGRDIKVQHMHVLVGIKWSGVSVLDELHLSRVLLYAKIYRHPKVVAIEQMIRSALILLATASEAMAVFELIYKHNDDELLAMTAPTLARKLNIDVEVADIVTMQRVNKAASIFADLRMRRLTAKAFQLQRTYPGSNQLKNETQKRNLITFTEVVEHPQNRELFRIELVDEVMRLISILGDLTLTRVDLEGSIMVHHIGKTPGGTQIGRAYLITKTGDPIEFKDYLVNRTAWADSYLSDQPSGYIFAEPQIADVTFVAIERILRVKFQISLPNSALEASKRNPVNIQKLKTRLNEVGYYNDAPYDIRPEPQRLHHADVARSIENFTHKYEIYQAPVDAENDEIVPPSANKMIRHWLRQFDSDDHVECAIRILDNLKMITRIDTVSAVSSFVKSNPSFAGAVVVPFGSARDSGVIHGYFAADLKGKTVSECMNLDEAFLRHQNRPIIFLDDFVGSGGQNRDILAAGFGRNDLRAELNESRNLFTSDIQNFLRSSKLGFVFTAGWDQGIAAVEKTTAELKLDVVTYRHIGEDKIPFLDKILSDLPREQAASFTQRCQEIGFEIMKSSNKPKNEESAKLYKQRMSNRALGYGNRGMLLASPFNVPTQSFTPLWASGEVNGVKWSPLLPRRKKL
jgi:deoxynucleoside triphosphate triphosphohydrolase SAMHD1